MCPLVLTDKQRGLQTVFQFVYQFEMGSSLQNFIGERYASIFLSLANRKNSFLMKRRQQRQQFLLAFQFPRTQAFHKPSKNVYAVIQTDKNKLVVKEKKSIKRIQISK